MSQTIMNLEEARELETRCAVRLGSDALMRRAGKAAAEWIAENIGKTHAVILAGPGNNGGDAIACALELKNMDWSVELVLPGGMPKSELARGLLAEWTAAGGTYITDPYDAARPGLAVDGLFGIGLARPVSGPYLDAVLWFNERQCEKIALDVPTGLDSETGLWKGGIPGVCARHTLTFLSAKSGLYMNCGADAAGEVTVFGLDVSVPLTRLGVIEPADYGHILQRRPNFSHKGTFGHAAIVGGDAGHAGAAILAARAALKLGAGTVTAELLAPSGLSFDPVMPELMLSPQPLDFSRFTAAVIGPGLGTSSRARARLEAALASDIPLVLDADALNLIAGSKDLLNVLLHRTAAAVITPHEAEGARLLGVTPQAIQSDRVNAVRDIALQTGAITVLKGPGTLVAMRSSRTWLNPVAASALATAGSGDALAGMIAAFLAQRYDTVESVLGAVALHSQAGLAYPGGITASGIIDAAQAHLGKLRAQAAH